MAQPILPTVRCIRHARLAFWFAAVSLASAGQAAPLPAGSSPTVSPSASPAAQSLESLPMALRSSDAHFIVMMIPHHEGAIAMADLALQRSRRAEILSLAERIRTSQSRENAQMRRWYRQWFGAEVPAWSGPGRVPSMGMGGGMAMGWGMPGLGVSLEALRAAPDGDRAFLELMIAHHRMGVMMASHAQWSTHHPELRQLEATMVQVQSQEIDQMSRWYRQWYGAGGKISTRR